MLFRIDSLNEKIKNDESFLKNEFEFELSSIPGHVLDCTDSSEYDSCTDVDNSTISNPSKKHRVGDIRFYGKEGSKTVDKSKNNEVEEDCSEG